MRILSLDLGFPRGPIDLHPFVSAVQGLDEMNREIFIEAVRLLAAGNTAGIRGLLDVNSNLIELVGDQNPLVGPVTTEDVAVMLDTLPMLANANPEALAAELDQARRRAKIQAVHVEEIRADLDPAAAARLQKLRNLMSEGEAEFEAAPTGEISKILAQFEGMQFQMYDMPAGVESIILRWNAYQESSANLGDLEANLASRVSVAEAAVISAEREYDEAVIAATPKLLDAEQEQRMEELAHPTEGRKKKTRARTDDEEAELNALLSSVGQPSYTAYRMYRVAPTALASDRALLEAAKGRLAAAREEIAHLKMGGGAPELTELKTELSAIRSAASHHLGSDLPEDIGSALMGLGTMVENPEWTSLAETLIAEMSEIGIGVPPMSAGKVPDYVAKWLHNYENNPEATSLALDTDELAKGIADAEVALANHARAMARIDRMEVESNNSRIRVAELEAALASAEGGSGASPEELLGYMDPIIDRIYSEAGGSAPFLIAGEFNGLSDDDVVAILNAYVPVSMDLQIIVVSERDAVAKWALSAGPDQAILSRSDSAAF